MPLPRSKYIASIPSSIDQSFYQTKSTDERGVQTKKISELTVQQIKEFTSKETDLSRKKEIISKILTDLLPQPFSHQKNEDLIDLILNNKKDRRFRLKKFVSSFITNNVEKELLLTTLQLLQPPTQQEFEKFVDLLMMNAALNPGKLLNGALELIQSKLNNHEKLVEFTSKLASQKNRLEVLWGTLESIPPLSHREVRRRAELIEADEDRYLFINESFRQLSPITSYKELKKIYQCISGSAFSRINHTRET